MKKNNSYGYIFFILTYVFLAAWLYKGILGDFSFCLSNKSPYNILALLSGASALCTIPSYIKHEKKSMRLLGYVTVFIGISILLIVTYRFFRVLPICQ